MHNSTDNQMYPYPSSPYVDYVLVQNININISLPSDCGGGRWMVYILHPCMHPVFARFGNKAMRVLTLPDKWLTHLSALVISAEINHIGLAGIDCGRS